MIKTIKARLSFLFFLQFAIAGAIFPVVALYMKEYLGFSGSQTGIILATSSVTAFVSPLLGAIVADKYLSAERLFGVCHLIASGLLFLLALQSSFFPVLILYFLFALFFGPTGALSNAIVFHHVPEGRDFGRMRLWGTVGWVFVAFGFGLFWLRQGGLLKDALLVAGFAGCAQGVFALFFLPKGEKRAASRGTLFPRDALKVYLRRDILFLSLVSLFFAVGEKIYYFGAGIFLKTLGMAESYVLPFMSIAQIAEVAAMLLLRPLLSKWRAKSVLLLGLAFSVIKFSLLAAADSHFLAGAGILFHGPAFTFFLVTVFIYLDRHCHREFRTGVHQIFNFIESGFANLMGNVGAGLLLDRFTLPHGGVNFSLFWAVPAVAAGILFLALLFFLSPGAGDAADDIPEIPEPGLEPTEGI